MPSLLFSSPAAIAIYDTIPQDWDNQSPLLVAPADLKDTTKTDFIFREGFSYPKDFEISPPNGILSKIWQPIVTEQLNAWEGQVPDYIALVNTGEGYKTFAKCDIPAGTVILLGSAKVLLENKPTKSTKKQSTPNEPGKRVRFNADKYGGLANFLPYLPGSLIIEGYPGMTNKTSFFKTLETYYIAHFKEGKELLLKQLNLIKTTIDEMPIKTQERYKATYQEVAELINLYNKHGNPTRKGTKEAWYNYLCINPEKTPWTDFKNQSILPLMVSHMIQSMFSVDLFNCQLENNNIMVIGDRINGLNNISLNNTPEGNKVLASEVAVSNIEFLPFFYKDRPITVGITSVEITKGSIIGWALPQNALDYHSTPTLYTKRGYPIPKTAYTRTGQSTLFLTPICIIIESYKKIIELINIPNPIKIKGQYYSSYHFRAALKGLNVVHEVFLPIASPLIDIIKNKLAEALAEEDCKQISVLVFWAHPEQLLIEGDIASEQNEKNIVLQALTRPTYTAITSFFEPNPPYVEFKRKTKEAIIAEKNLELTPFALG